MKAALAPQRAEGDGRHRGAAVPRRDGARRPGIRRAARAAKKTRLVCVEMVHGSAGSSAIGVKKNLWAPAAVGRDFDLAPTSLRSLEPFRDHPDHRQQHRRRSGEAVHGDGNRRRSLPLERRVPHPGASEADPGRRRPGRRLARSALRAAVRPGHADPVDAAVHRERRSGRRLRLRLLLRLHRRDQLGRGRAAAADDPRSARRLRQAVRRAEGRRRRRQSARERLAEDRSILDWLLVVGRAAAEHARAGRSRALVRLPRKRARDRAPHPERRGATTAAASCASCRRRRPACPIRSASTSS